MKSVALGILVGILVKAAVFWYYNGLHTCYGFDLVATAAVASFLAKREEN